MLRSWYNNSDSGTGGNAKVAVVVTLEVILVVVAVVWAKGYNGGKVVTMVVIIMIIWLY